MSDRTWCDVCNRWIGGGVGHRQDKHDNEERQYLNRDY